MSTDLQIKLIFMFATHFYIQFSVKILKNTRVIKTIPLAFLSVGKLLMCLKLRGFLDLPTKRVRFSVLSAFVQNKTVFTLLLAFPVTLFSFHSVCSIGEEIQKQSSFICVKDVSF